MTRVVLAGGGTAGHVNPLLAVAEALQAQHGLQPSDMTVIGTAEGLESRLVPEAGLSLHTIARLPLPRKLSLRALSFGPRFLGAVFRSWRILGRHQAEVVAGFGGYACAPVYVAAWLRKTPIVIHEANAVAGFANRLGARFTRHVLTAFPTPGLPGARIIGMPMARAMTHPPHKPSASAARSYFGLSPRKKTLVVTGGSQGARNINTTVTALVPTVISAGWQVLHIVGGKNPVPSDMPPGYVGLSYCDRMDLAFAAATAVISRAGSATVSEIQMLSIPAIFVPYPVGNGEQEKNAADSFASGAAVLVRDADFTPENVAVTVWPLLQDQAALKRMKSAASGLGRRDAAQHMAQTVMDSVQKAQR